MTFCIYLLATAVRVTTRPREAFPRRDAIWIPRCSRAFAMELVTSPFAMRIVDRVCSSSESICVQLTWTCDWAGLSLSSTLECNQLMSSCGYITVAMVVTLRGKALANGRIWRHVVFNVKISFSCVRKRDLVFDASSERVVILTADQVINFVRSFNNIPSDSISQEELWSGVITFDHLGRPSDTVIQSFDLKDQ